MFAIDVFHKQVHPLTGTIQKQSVFSYINTKFLLEQGRDFYCSLHCYFWTLGFNSSYHTIKAIPDLSWSTLSFIPLEHLFANCFYSNYYFCDYLFTFLSPSSKTMSFLRKRTPPTGIPSIQQYLDIENTQYMFPE